MMHLQDSLSTRIARLAATVLACLVGATPLFAQSPCDGRITDKARHPLTPHGVPKPAAGQSYTDPVFGTRITRISNANPADGDNAIISTLYNSMRGWNADGSQIIAWRRAGSRDYMFYNGNPPYGVLGEIQFGKGFAENTWPADIEHVIWDATDPNVLYYPAYDGNSARAHPLLMKVTLGWPSPPVASVVRDFYPECVAHHVAANMMNVLLSLIHI